MENEDTENSFAKALQIFEGNLLGAKNHMAYESPNTWCSLCNIQCSDHHRSISLILTESFYLGHH